jgi:hypothetical protein
MTHDQQDKPTHRFSRYSRSTLEDLSSGASRVQPEPSLAEMAARALNGFHDTPSRSAPVHGAWDQPPPPEPSQFWEGEASPRPAAPQIALNLRAHRTLQTPPAVVVPQPHAEAREIPDPLPLAGEPEPPAEAAQPAADAHAADIIEPIIELRPRERAEPKSPPAFIRAATKAGTLIREKAGPALMQGAFWLAHNLRRREIRKRYSRLLVVGHTRIADRKLEELFFVPTRQAERIDPDPQRGIHYDGPVTAAAFNWIMALMPQDLRQFAFVDIRAGRGRNSLLAARYGFARIVAHEWGAAMFDDLEMNVAQYPRSRMTCRRIDCYRADLRGLVLPDQPCIIWFSGAWREPLIGSVMNDVRDAFRQNPRPIYVVLENADADAALEHDTIFEAIEPPLAERLKLKLFSPVDFKVYRSSC